MQGTRPAGVLLLFAALLLAASASQAAGAYHGRVVISHGAADGTSTRASAHLHAALAKLEDEVAPDLSRAASFLGGVGSGIGYGPLKAEKPACPGPCPAKGESYTGRGCNSKYQCPPH